MSDIWDTIAAEAQRQQAPPAAPGPSADDIWKNIESAANQQPQAGYVGQILHGLGRGVAAIPGIPGDVANLETKALGLFAPKAAEAIQQFMPPTSEKLVNFAQDNLIGQKPAATSPGADFAGRVAAYVPSALLGGPEGLLGRTALAGASGAASEGAKDLGLPAPYQIAAGMAPGLLASGAQFLRSPAATAVEPAARYMAPGDWAAGKALQQAGQDVGVPLMAHEALAPNVGGGPLAQLAGDVRATPEGGAVISKVFEARPQQITDAAKRATAAIGPASTAPDALNAVRDVAGTAIRQAERARTAATKPLFDAAGQGNVPPDAVNNILASVGDAIDSAGPNSALGKQLATLRGRMLTDTGDPETRVSRLQRVYMELRDSLEMPPDAGGAQRSSIGTLSPLAGDIRDMLVAENPTFARANALYQQLSAPVVALKGTADNPGLVRRIAEAGSNAELQKLLLDPENVSPATVTQLADMFQQQGRTGDLSGWMRHYLETSLNKASTDLQSGQNPALGVNWRKMVYGNPAQRAVLNSYFDQIDPSGSAGRGFDKLMAVLERTGRTPGMGSPTAGRLQTAETLANSPVPMAAATGAAAGLGAAGIPVAGGLMLGNKSLGFIQRAAREMGSRDIANALTAPDAVERLQTLARRDPASAPALRSALAILSGQNAHGE